MDVDKEETQNVAARRKQRVQKMGSGRCGWESRKSSRGRWIDKAVCEKSSKVCTVTNGGRIQNQIMREKEETESIIRGRKRRRQKESSL